MAFPVPRGQVRRRDIPAVLHRAGGDVRVLPAGARDSHRPQDGQGRDRRVRRAQQKIQVVRVRVHRRAHHYSAVLLRHRRLGNAVHRRVLRGRRHAGGRRRRPLHVERILQFVHDQPLAAPRVLPHLRLGDRGRRGVRRAEGDRAHKQDTHAAARRDSRVPDDIRAHPARRDRGRQGSFRARFLRVQVRNVARRARPALLFDVAGDGHHDNVRLIYEKKRERVELRPPDIRMRHRVRHRRGHHNHPVHIRVLARPRKRHGVVRPLSDVRPAPRGVRQPPGRQGDRRGVLHPRVLRGADLLHFAGGSHSRRAPRELPPQTQRGLPHRVRVHARAGLAVLAGLRPALHDRHRRQEIAGYVRLLLKQHTDAARRDRHLRDRGLLRRTENAAGRDRLPQELHAPLFPRDDTLRRARVHGGDTRQRHIHHALSAVIAACT